MNGHVRVLESDGLLRLTLDRPPLNVLTTEMLRGLESALSTTLDRPEIRVVRLDAEGKAFSAGVDIADHEGDKVRSMMDALESLFVTFEKVEIPVVSVVHAAALGGGCELTLGSDLCLAARGAKFGQPEIRLGLFAPPATVLLPRWIGERAAADLLLTGRTISAEEALSLGLVSRVFDDGQLAGAAGRLIEEMLSFSGVALRQTKKALRTARTGTVPRAHRRVNELYLTELMRTRDAHEGLRAFMEKRAPDWLHR